MKQKRKYFTILIVFVIFLSTLQSIQGNQASWNEGSKYTWLTYSRFGSHYENETATWDYYYFGLNHRLESKILDINSLEKEVSLEESWYFTPSADKPFTVQEVEHSYDLIGGLASKDIISLFHFIYEFDDIENETYLSDVQVNNGETRFPIRYFCTADWGITNSLIQAVFDNSIVINTVNGTEITFQDFLDNCTYSIMGESDYTFGLDKMVPTNHHWAATFDYSGLLEARGPEITSFEVEEANATFVLRYSEGGVLEEFYKLNKIIIEINNNYTYHQYNTRHYTLTESNPARSLLVKIIPATLVGVIVIVIVILFVRTMKKRKM